MAIGVDRQWDAPPLDDALETGIFVVDIWESEELLGKFAEILIPIIAATGATPPEPRILQIHNTITI